jgi:hypothetical protein
LQGIQKYTKLGIFVMQIYHLATLPQNSLTPAIKTKAKFQLSRGMKCSLFHLFEAVANISPPF